MEVLNYKAGLGFIGWFVIFLIIGFIINQFKTKKKDDNTNMDQ
jgi:hypothetical protein